MPTRSVSMYGILGGELLDGVFLVGQAVIAQVAVPEVVIPLGTLRVAAPVADFDHDKSALRKGHIGVAGREGLGHRLGLRARIHVFNDRIAFVRGRSRRACTSRRTGR